MGKIVGLIPARMESTRFPGKPIIDIYGVPMVVRVFNQAKKCAFLDEVYICTDSEIIAQTAKEHHCKVILTTSNPQNGTERCAEALELLNDTFDYIINIQGDEPNIAPQQIEQICKLLAEEKYEIVTLGIEIKDKQDFTKNNIVKAILDKSDFAIDFERNIDLADTKKILKHIGIYGFKTAILKSIVKMKPTTNEIIKSLEQMRWLDNGIEIKVGITNFESIAIDLPDDIQKLKKYY